MGALRHRFNSWTLVAATVGSTLTHEMDVLLHLEKDKRLSACLQYFLRPLYQSLRTLL